MTNYVWQPVKAIVPQPTDEGGMSIVGIHYYDAAEWSELCGEGEPEFALCVKVVAVPDVPDVPVEAIRTSAQYLADQIAADNYNDVPWSVDDANQQVRTWLDQQQEER